MGWSQQGTIVFQYFWENGREGDVTVNVGSNSFSLVKVENEDNKEWPSKGAIFRLEGNLSGKKLTEVWGSNAINIVVTAADDLADNRDYADNFTDAAFIPHWSGDQVGAAAKAGYMGGYPDGSFKPQNPITRAEALVALNRVIQEGI